MVISSAGASCGAPKLVTMVNHRVVWVLGSVALILVHGGSLSRLGFALLLVQAIAVAAVLVLKLAGVAALRS